MQNGALTVIQRNTMSLISDSTESVFV